MCIVEVWRESTFCRFNPSHVLLIIPGRQALMSYIMNVFVPNIWENA